MFWKALFATVAFGIVFIAYMVLTPALSAVSNWFITNPTYGTLCIPGGMCVGQFIAQNFMLFELSFVVIVVFLIIYLIAASQADENDSGVIGYTAGGP
jgi:hypothetical protein